jgi:hypothetical protein
MKTIRIGKNNNRESNWKLRIMKKIDITSLLYILLDVIFCYRKISMFFIKNTAFEILFKKNAGKMMK